LNSPLNLHLRGLKSRHKHLLNDQDIRRWYDNVARGSVITAEERLRRLGRFGQSTGLDPKSIIEKKRASPDGFDDFIMDYVDGSLARVFTMGATKIISLLMGK